MGSWFLSAPQYPISSTEEVCQNKYCLTSTSQLFQVLKNDLLESSGFLQLPISEGLLICAFAISALPSPSGR